MKVCAKRDMVQNSWKESCGKIRSEMFKHCHKIVHPDRYYESCLEDTCVAKDKEYTLCTSIQVYADACYNKGVVGLRWRSQSFCRE